MQFNVISGHASNQLPLQDETSVEKRSNKKIKLTDKQSSALRVNYTEPREMINFSLPVSNDRLLTAELEKHLADSPQKTLSTYQGQTLSYEQVYAAAETLAKHLMQKFQIPVGTPVAISGSNKLELLIAEIALLKIGAVFVPIDPLLNEYSKQAILQDAGIKHMVTCSDENSYNCETLCIKTCLDSQYPNSPAVEFPAIPNSAPAYILYTSGSTTGKPKGVVQTREALLGNIRNYSKDLNITKEDQLLQLATFSHDQAIVDVFAALLNGCSIHLIDFNKAQMDVNQVRKTIQQMGVTIFSSIPQVFKIIFENVEASNDFPALRVVTIGGEAVLSEHVRIFQKIASDHAELINGYGATECSWIASHSIKKNDPTSTHRSFPLGVLTDKVDAIIEPEDSNNPNRGELFISTPYMCKGYHNGVSSESFKKIGEKIYYKTGDIVEKKTNGEKELYLFIGRCAGHVKINGQRINTFEIEEKIKTQLKKFIENLVITSLSTEKNKEKGNRLVAIYQLKEGEKLTNGHLKKACKFFLKDLEIPAEFIKVQQIPTLRNGKVNRQKCIEIASSKSVYYSKEDAEAYFKGNTYDGVVTSRLFHCRSIAKILAKTLDIPVSLIKNDTSLANLGFNSIQMFQISNLINKKLHLKTIQSDLFKGIKLDFIDLVDYLNDICSERKIKSDRPNFIRTDIVFNRHTIEYWSPNFKALEVLSQHFYKKENICIKPCLSKNELLDEARNYFNSSEENARGFMVTQTDHRFRHFSGLAISKERDELFIMDSLGLESKAYVVRILRYAKEIAGIYKEKFNKDLKISVDVVEKQQDSQSCVSLTFDYLLEVVNNFNVHKHSGLISYSPSDSVALQRLENEIGMSISYCFPYISSLRFLQPEYKNQYFKGHGLPPYGYVVKLKNPLADEKRDCSVKKKITILAPNNQPIEMELDTYFIDRTNEFKSIVENYQNGE